MPKNTTAAGTRAETQACDYLTHNGYKIIERNYRDRFCEIDIVAANRRYICFVEVKYRARVDFGGAAGSVTPAKQQRLRTAAEYWLAQHPKYGHLQPRVDVITIEGGDQLQLSHLEDVILQ